MDKPVCFILNVLYRYSFIYLFTSFLQTKGVHNDYDKQHTSSMFKISY